MISYRHSFVKLFLGSYPKSVEAPGRVSERRRPLTGVLQVGAELLWEGCFVIGTRNWSVPGRVDGYAWLAARSPARKPRRLQGSGGAISSLLFTVAALVFGRFVARNGHSNPSRPAEFQFPRFMAAQVAARKTATSATGCCAGRRNSANGTGPPGKRPADRLCGNEEPLRC